VSVRSYIVTVRVEITGKTEHDFAAALKMLLHSGPWCFGVSSTGETSYSYSDGRVLLIAQALDPITVDKEPK